MKKIILVCLLALLLPGLAAAGFEKTKLAVLDFELQGQKFETDNMGSMVAEWFITALVKDGRFEVVERTLLKKILDEQKLVMSGVVEENVVKELGKILGVKIIISGAILRIGKDTEVNARIIDVVNASIIAAENIRGSGTGSLQDLIITMSERIIKNFPLEGYVVARDGEMVTIDVGMKSGAKLDMEFLVYKEGNVIKHPKTGQVLDVEQIETGKIKIEKVQDKIAIGRIIKGKAEESIVYGQSVKSMTSPKVIAAEKVTEKAAKAAKSTNTKQSSVDEAPAITEKKDPQPERKAVVAQAPPSPPAPIQPPPAPTPIQTFTPAPIQAPPPPVQQRSLSREASSYQEIFETGSLPQQNETAKSLGKRRISDTEILNVVEKALLRGHTSNGDNKHHIDTMAWLCRILGNSGDKNYRDTLQKVAQHSSNSKIKKHAEKSLEMLH